MGAHLQVSFHELEHSATLDQAIRDKAAKLDAFHPRLQSLRVVVEKQSRHARQGNRFEVRIDVHVPGQDFAVSHADEDVMVALRDAFDAARRRLDEAASAAHPAKTAARRERGERNERDELV